MNEIDLSKFINRGYDIYHTRWVGSKNEYFHHNHPIELEDLKPGSMYYLDINHNRELWFMIKYRNKLYITNSDYSETHQMIRKLRVSGVSLYKIFKILDL